MYVEEYGMKRLPFVRNIPCDSLYVSPQIHEALGKEEIRE